jgi:hypothetical protein
MLLSNIVTYIAQPQAASPAETIRASPIDIERLSMKAHLWKEVYLD